MTSEQQYEQAETDFVEHRERFKDTVYSRIETLIREKFPTSTGYEGAADFDDGFMQVFVAAVIDPSVDGGKRRYDEWEDDEPFAEQLGSAVSWLDVVDPQEYQHGFSIEWED